ncbi:MAG TPA: hypothetical protein VGI33_12510 [Paenibacillus sp.]|jgi:hypothetical protein
MLISITQRDITINNPGAFSKRDAPYLAPYSNKQMTASFDDQSPLEILLYT